MKTPVGIIGFRGYSGAELEANYPVSAVVDGVGLNITVLSYRDHLDFGIVGDRDRFPDLWSLIDWLREGLEELEPRQAPDAEPAPASAK